MEKRKGIFPMSKYSEVGQFWVLHPQQSLVTIDCSVVVKLCHPFSKNREYSANYR